MSRNSNGKEVFIERFEAKHARAAQAFYVNPEKCGNPDHFEGYIRWDAFGDYRMGLGTTHVMAEYDNNEVFIDMWLYFIKSSFTCRHY